MRNHYKIDHCRYSYNKTTIESKCLGLLDLFLLIILCCSMTHSCIVFMCVKALNAVI